MPCWWESCDVAAGSSDRGAAASDVGGERHYAECCGAAEGGSAVDVDGGASRADELGVLGPAAGLVRTTGRAAVLPEVLQEGDVMTEAELFFEQNAMGGVSLPMLDGSHLFPRDVRWAGPGVPEVIGDYQLPDGRVLVRHVGVHRDLWAIDGKVALAVEPDVEMGPSSLN